MDVEDLGGSAGIQLGETYRDKYTGIRGVATARTEFLGGGPQIRLEFQFKDGELRREWIDEGRLVVVDRRSGQRM